MTRTESLSLAVANATIIFKAHPNARLILLLDTTTNTFQTADIFDPQVLTQIIDHDDLLVAAFLSPAACSQSTTDRITPALSALLAATATSELPLYQLPMLEDLFHLMRSEATITPVPTQPNEPQQ